MTFPQGKSAGHEAARLDWIWRLAALVCAIYAVATCVEFVLWDAHLLPSAGTIGAEQAQFSPAPSAGPGFVQVGEIAKGSPLERAGVVAGDSLRFDPIFDYQRYRRAGETVKAVVDHGGKRAPQTFTAVPRTGAADWEAVRFDLGNTIPAVFGLLILLRSRGRITALLLAGALITFGPPSASAMMLEGQTPLSFLVFSGFNRTCIVLVCLFLIGFAMRFVSETVGGVDRRQWYALAAYSALNFVVLCLWCACAFTMSTLPIIGDVTGVLSLLGYVGLAASLVYLTIGWRRSTTVERSRFALFLAGAAALIVAQVVSFIVFLGLRQLYTLSHPLLLFAEVLSGLVAPVLLSHAILRHRVLDLGFVINRTLVYGAVSAILLIAFGLIEWAFDHFVKIEGREKNALLDAAIALGVYLTFHRFRHSTERRIEAVFFRAWHERETAFRRSISRAGFINAPIPLMEAAASAFDDFSDATAVGLYLKDQEGDYRLEHGTGTPDAASIGQNHPVTVALRADPRACQLEGDTLPGVALALPMAHRNDLLGFVLLGAKMSGNVYRADELEVLEWAANQIGLDLHALSFDRLEAKARAQDQQINILQMKNDLLSAISPPATGSRT